MTNPNPNPNQYPQPAEPVHRAMAARAMANATETNRENRINEYNEHLAQISGDPEGTDIAGRFTPEAEDICRQFIRRATALKLPRIEPIKLEVGLFGQYLWRSPGRYDVDSPFKGLIRKTVWTGQGYHVGTLADDANKAAVMLCPEEGSDNFVLRCERKPSSFPMSKGTGFGRLPDGVGVRARPGLLKVLTADYLVGPPPKM